MLSKTTRLYKVYQYVAADSDYIHEHEREFYFLIRLNWGIIIQNANEHFNIWKFSSKNPIKLQFIIHKSEGEI